MKTIECDLCGKQLVFESLEDLGGWMLQTRKTPELCPEHTDELMEFMIKVRDNWFRVKKKKLDNRLAELVQLKSVH